MASYYIFTIIIFIFQRINPLYISMNVTKIDDCLRKIEIVNGVTIYQKSGDDCPYEFKTGMHYDIPEQIPYELGQKIKIIIGDKGKPNGSCGFNIDITLNNNIIIKNNNQKVWSCDNCYDNGFFESNDMYNCYPPKRTTEGEPKNYTFYFQINSLEQLDYFYYLNNTKYYFLSPNDLNNTIDLIDLYSENNLYLQNKEGQRVLPLYDSIYYKLFFDKYSNHKGIFYGSEEQALNETTFSRIIEYKNLRYELSDKEKNKKGVYLKLKIGIYDNQKAQILALEDFNFFICLDGYQFCDLETSMKCLKEGYYQIDDRYYSCYETCKTCNRYKKPDEADYFNNYCDECKEEYSHFINIVKDGKEYKSCYKECPLHAPILKDYGNKECVSYCPRYKTSDRRCVDFCDDEYFKYLLKNESIYAIIIFQRIFLFILMII